MQAEAEYNIRFRIYWARHIRFKWRL